MTGWHEAWTDGLDAAMADLRTARTAPEVQAVLDRTCDPAGIGSGTSFWSGDGDELWGALQAAGWETHRWEAGYYWVMRRSVPAIGIGTGWNGTTNSTYFTHVDQFIAYTEGDVDYADNPHCGGGGR